MKRLKKLLIPAFILLLLLMWALDMRLETTYYSYTSEKIPASFDGCNILVLSDLHCKVFGKEQVKLIQAVKDANPQLIVLTGDVVDEHHDDLTGLEQLLAGIYSIAPIYYVSGNHDLYPQVRERYGHMLTLFSAYGVTDLDDARTDFIIGNDKITLSGQKWRSKYVTEYIRPAADSELFNILLYHGSDYFPLVADYNYDLVLSGHAHGGIIRIPFTSIGLLGNEGNFFPEYSGGIYQLGNSTLISSRGLGGADFPRVFNRPEVVCITLHSAGVTGR